MFKSGQTIIYGAIGVCEIVDIIENDLTGVMRKYYVLKSQDNTKSVIYVPVDNEKLVSRMRKVVTKQELKRIIAESADIYEWINNPIERTQTYREIYTDGMIPNVIKLLRTLHNRKIELESINKHMPKSDDCLYKDCVKFLGDICTVVLSSEQDEVIDIILG